MKGYLTTYAGLFQPAPGDCPQVDSVEIPLIQRDYAQGRQQAGVAEIRAGFLEVLLDAVAGGEPLAWTSSTATCTMAPCSPWTASSA